MSDTPPLTDAQKALHAEKYEIDWEPVEAASPHVASPLYVNEAGDAVRPVP